VRVPLAPAIVRAIPDYELLDEAALAAIEDAAETVLAEIGIAFVENPAALERWRRAGAEIQGETVRLPRGMARELCATAPGTFTQVARNPERSVEIGGRGLVLAPVYGPPFARRRHRRA
jgi:trimethylamine--corrinoid protein Co-methyltransferase